MHVLGYLGDAATATFNPGAPAAQTWFLTQARAVLEGRADQVAAEIRRRADRFRCTGTERTKVLAAATCCRARRLPMTASLPVQMSRPSLGGR